MGKKMILILTSFGIVSLGCGDSSTSPNGKVGSSGSNGTAGAAGASGTMGVSGAMGAMGSTGPAGADGVSGPAGPQGATGATGPAGSSGAQGATGLNGQSGPPGQTGPVGATGPAGGPTIRVITAQSDVLGLPTTGRYATISVNPNTPDGPFPGVMLYKSTLPGVRDGEILLDTPPSNIWFSDGNCLHPAAVNTEVNTTWAGVLVWALHDPNHIIWRVDSAVGSVAVRSYGPGGFGPAGCSALANGPVTMDLKKLTDTGARLDVNASFPWTTEAN